MKLISNIRCSHCNSSEMESIGMFFGGLHIYYKCLNCREFTEYNLSTKNMLFADISIVLIMVIIIAISSTLIEYNALLAFMFFLASTILYGALVHKYRLRGYEKVAISRLPDNLWIISPLRRKIRLIAFAIIFVAVLIYAGLIFVNIIRQGA